MHACGPSWVSQLGRLALTPPWPVHSSYKNMCKNNSTWCILNALRCKLLVLVIVSAYQNVPLDRGTCSLMQRIYSCICGHLCVCTHVCVSLCLGHKSWISLIPLRVKGVRYGKWEHREREESWEKEEGSGTRRSRQWVGSLVVRTPRFHCRGMGSIPGWGTNIPLCCLSSQGYGFSSGYVWM